MFEIISLPPHALDTFQCGNLKESSDFRRMNIWGEGSCFFHSVAALLVYKNKIKNNHIYYYLAIPNAKCLPKDMATKDGDVHCLCFKVPLKYSKDKFTRHFKDVGIKLRTLLSTTITKQRYDQFCNEAFSSDLMLTMKESQPTWEEVKTKLAQPQTWADIWTVKYSAWALCLNLLFINGTNRSEPIYCGVENFNAGPYTLFIFWSGMVHFEPIVEVGRDEVTVRNRVFHTNHPFIECLRQRYESNMKGGCNMKAHQ